MRILQLYDAAGDIPTSRCWSVTDSKKRASKSWALLLPDHLAHHHEKDKMAGLSSLAQVLARGRSEGCTSSRDGEEDRWKGSFSNLLQESVLTFWLVLLHYIPPQQRDVYESSQSWYTSPILKFYCYEIKKTKADPSNRQYQLACTCNSALN